MSYCYLWNYIQQVENTLGEPIVETYKGGKSGGGGAKLTKEGKNLLDEYNCLESNLSEFLSNAKQAEVKGLKLSARNNFKGKVVAVGKGTGVSGLVLMCIPRVA